MADISSDADMLSDARTAVGPVNSSAITDEDLRQALDGIKGTVTEEVRRSLDRETVNVYHDGAIEDLAKHLFRLRVADLKRRKENNPSGHVAAKPVPESPSALRRHNFENDTLGHWRDQMIRAHQRLTE